MDLRCLAALWFLCGAIAAQLALNHTRPPLPILALIILSGPFGVGIALFALRR